VLGAGELENVSFTALYDRQSPTLQTARLLGAQRDAREERAVAAETAGGTQ
jgi:hypothetical protein